MKVFVAKTFMQAINRAVFSKIGTTLVHIKQFIKGRSIYC